MVNPLHVSFDRVEIVEQSRSRAVHDTAAAVEEGAVLIMSLDCYEIYREVNEIRRALETPPPSGVGANNRSSSRRHKKKHHRRLTTSPISNKKAARQQPEDQKEYCAAEGGNKRSRHAQHRLLLSEKKQSLVDSPLRSSKSLSPTPSPIAGAPKMPLRHYHEDSLHQLGDSSTTRDSPPQLPKSRMRRLSLSPSRTPLSTRRTSGIRQPMLIRCHTKEIAPELLTLGTTLAMVQS